LPHVARSVSMFYMNSRRDYSFFFPTPAAVGRD
jgi:hypothetical protein